MVARWGPVRLGITAWALAGSVLMAAVAPLAARQASSEAPAPGWLDRGTLTAEVVQGVARLEVVLDLRGTRGRTVLPLQLLAYGGAPREVAATVDGRTVAVTLEESRTGFWSGAVVPEAPLPDSVRLRLTYRLDEPLRWRDGDGAWELALSWLLVPWAPPDGSPGRVRMELGFQDPVTLEAPFPASLRPVDAGGEGSGARWEASLPVLPSLSRARVPGSGVDAVPADAHPTEPGSRDSGATPSVPSPGFVFHGLFLVFGAVTVGYALWMLRWERRR